MRHYRSVAPARNRHVQLVHPSQQLPPPDGMVAQRVRELIERSRTVVPRPGHRTFQIREVAAVGADHVGKRGDGFSVDPLPGGRERFRGEISEMLDQALSRP